MKIAISSKGDKLSSPFESRFGRAPFFIVYDTLLHHIEAVANKQNYQAVQGAGIQSAQHLIEKGVEVLVTSSCGPKAFFVLNAANIKVYCTQVSTVEEAIEEYKQGKLTPLEQANVESHH
jgi:predicted Fe-Mo cluster-binding NifX family protein